MLEPRITGTEMEWPVAVQYTPDKPYIPIADQTALAVIKGIAQTGLKNCNSFYANGSLIYKDVGNQLEYATPEDTSFIGTTANELAGEEIIYGALKKAQGAGLFHSFMLNKRVVDDDGSTWGYHESYSVDSEKVAIRPSALALLGIHLATRGLFYGAGVVRSIDGKPQFLLAQKSANLEEDYSSATTRNKPVVNLRDEPHRGTSSLGRIHVISGDPNMSPWATTMKLASTSLVIRLMEHGVTLDHLQVDSLCELAAHVASDLSLRRVVRLSNGVRIRPVEIQGSLLEAARELSESGRVELPLEEQQAIAQWQIDYDDAREDPMLLSNRADWVAKYRTIERFRDKYELAISDERVHRKDRQWDTIHPNSIGKAVREKLWGSFMPSSALVEMRKTSPPESTRAAIRGKAIARRQAVISSMDWEYITVDSAKVLLAPHQTQSAALDQLLYQREAA